MLRRANDGDIPSIQSILNRPENWDKLEAYPDEALRAALQDPMMTVFIWEDEGAWAGFCWLRAAPEGPKIEEFGVMKPGQGTGARFFSAVLDAISDGDRGPPWLAVAADNLAAIRFYERFGFVRGTLNKSAWHRRKGPVADALIMRLAR